MKKVLVILGPTSTGKTDLAINLAGRFGGEIVSADSRQVYKYLDIGTGKLPGKFQSLKKGENFWEIDGTKIWMYDVTLPEKRYNLYEYLLEVQKVIDKITSRGNLPIITGGSGLYIRSLIEGISDFGADENLDFRNELEKGSLEEIKVRLKKENPEIFHNLNNSEINNKRRLIRILEKQSNNSRQPYPGLKKNYDVLKIGLSADRELLKERIKNRLEKRIREGMIEESRKLISDKLITDERMDELGLEYRYLAKFLRGEIKTEKDLVEILTTKIGQFAKRQMTWFAKEPDVFWVDTKKPGFESEVEKKVGDWYNNKGKD